MLEETKALLVKKHEFGEAEQEAYVRKILIRFSNEHLPDTVGRVDRAPLRKLSRHERFIGPAAELAENGVTPVALLEAIDAALRFADAGHAEVVGWLPSSKTTRPPTPRHTSPGWPRGIHCSRRYAV